MQVKSVFHFFPGKLLLLLIGIGFHISTRAQDCNVDFPGSSSQNFSNTCVSALIPALNLGNTIFLGDNDTFTFDAPATITINGDLVIRSEGNAKIIIPAGVTVHVDGNILLYPENNGCEAGNVCTFEMQVDGTLGGDENFQNNLNMLIWSGTGTVNIDNHFENAVKGCMECSTVTCPAFPNSGSGDCQDNGIECGSADFCTEGNYGSTTPVQNDISPPDISGCPNNQTVSISAPNCEETVNWVAPIATDDVGVSSFVSDYSPGDSFPLGTTTVTYTAKDLSGNTSICTFDVTVNDNSPPVIADCPGDIVMDLSGSNCEEIVDWKPPTASDNCKLDSFVSSYNPGAAFSLGTTTVTYTATDHAGNKTICSFNITIKDQIAPLIEQCSPSVSILSYDDMLESAVVSWDVPVASDNCEKVSLTGSHNPGDSFPKGKTTVTYTAQDGTGNTATCSFEVEVTGNNAPVAQPVSISVAAGQQVNICMEATDPDGDNLMLKQVNYSSENGKIDSIDASNLCFTYTSKGDFEGDEIFTVIICDDKDPLACVETEVQIMVSKDKQLIIYKAFTPDNDNINDTWQIGNIEYYPDNQVMIFDRWGSLVYKAAGYNNENVIWDGSSNQGITAGKKTVPSGTYFYAIDLGDGQGQLNGFIELVQ